MLTLDLGGQNEHIYLQRPCSSTCETHNVDFCSIWEGPCRSCYHQTTTTLISSHRFLRESWKISMFLQESHSQMLHFYDVMVHEDKWCKIRIEGLTEQSCAGHRTWFTFLVFSQVHKATLSAKSQTCFYLKRLKPLTCVEIIPRS